MREPDPDIPEPLKKWAWHIFSSGATAGKDYVDFQREYTKFLRKELHGYGVKINEGHYYFSAVVTMPESGGAPEKYVYVHISDVRFFPRRWATHVLMRRMRDKADWIGMTNNYCKARDIRKTVERLMEGEL